MSRGILGAMLGNMLQAERNWKAGQILIESHGGWQFGDQGYYNYSGMYIQPMQDDDARPISLTRIPCTRNCPNTEFTGLYPKIRGAFQVPMKVCRKCRFHRKAPQRGLRFPKCEMLIQIRASADEPEVATAKLLAEAIDKAKEILK